MREQRTREEIEMDSMTPFERILVEIVLDGRDQNSEIVLLLQKLVEKDKEKAMTLWKVAKQNTSKVDSVELETSQGPVKVRINGVLVEEGDEIV